MEEHVGMGKYVGTDKWSQVQVWTNDDAYRHAQTNWGTCRQVPPLFHSLNLTHNHLAKRMAHTNWHACHFCEVTGRAGESEPTGTSNTVGFIWHHMIHGSVWVAGMSCLEFMTHHFSRSSRRRASKSKCLHPFVFSKPTACSVDWSHNKMCRYHMWLL